MAIAVFFRKLIIVFYICFLGAVFMPHIPADLSVRVFVGRKNDGNIQNFSWISVRDKPNSYLSFHLNLIFFQSRQSVIDFRQNLIFRVAKAIR